MGLNIWYIFASLLLVLVGASCYDQGPQKFYEVSYDSEAAEQNENKEVIVYLTPDQVKALEAEGAVVRAPEDSQNDEADSGLSTEQQANDDQEVAQVLQQEGNEDAQQEEEAQQEEQENSEEIQDEDIEFEEILRILNEEAEEAAAEEKAEEQARNEPQVEEENTENSRKFSPKITLPQQQQQQKNQQQDQDEIYLAPAVTKNEQILNFIRFQPNSQRQTLNVQLLQQQQALPDETKEAEQVSEEPQTEAPTQEKRKYKLIPYEVVEPQETEQNAEEPAQENADTEENDVQIINDIITPPTTLNADRLNQRKNRLESILRELKASTKYNDQKYAIEIERLRANFEKLNVASRAETKAKTELAQTKQQLNKKSVNKTQQGKGPAREAETQQTKFQQLRAQKSSEPLTNARPIPIPVLKAEKPEGQKSIAVPVETSKRVSIKKVYVSTRTDKPFIIARRVPEKRPNPVEVATIKPERITILRHIWQQ